MAHGALRAAAERVSIGAGGELYHKVCRNSVSDRNDFVSSLPVKAHQELTISTHSIRLMFVRYSSIEQSVAPVNGWLNMGPAAARLDAGQIAS